MRAKVLAIENTSSILLRRFKNKSHFHMNPLKALQVVNTVLLVGVILFLVFGSGRTESGEKVKFFGKSEEDRDASESKEA